MENIEALINNYISYYRKTYPDKNIKNMFDDINYDDKSSTNHIMEIFYEDLLKHKNNNNKDIYIDFNDIDINNVDELYALKIDEEIKYISESIISLLYVVTNDKYDNWYIINLK